MLNLAFCDDDENFLNNIVPIIEQQFIKQKIKVDSSLFLNGDKLVEAFKLRCPYFDIIFLDIDMPHKSGKEIAKELRLIDKNFKLVFITAYEHEALNMFQYDVIGFIPKDKLDIYLSDTIKRAIKIIEEDQPKMQFFRIYDSYGHIAEIRMPLNDIKYIEILQKDIFLHCVFERYQLYHYRFMELVDNYLQMGFLDIHRTCIVNPKFVVKIGEDRIILDNGEELLMSRRKRKRVLNYFVQNIYEGIMK